MADYDGSPLTYPPLGLPSGSVRALLTLSCVTVVVANTARGVTLDVFWIEALLIAMAHYFTTRRFVNLPPGVLAQLERDNLIERESHPLFLPRGSIRALIIASFVGLAWYLYQNDRERLMSTPVLTLLALVGAYFFGAIVRGVTGFWTRVRRRPPSRWWADLRALLALAAVAVAAIPELLGATYLHQDIVRHTALGVMLFYFGSR